MKKMPKSKTVSIPPSSPEPADLPSRANRDVESKFNLYIIIIFLLTLMVPVLVLPMVVDNAFNAPKTMLILIGVSLMLGIYCFQYLRGQAMLKPETSTPKIILFLILLNFFSFFYTGNYYFTIVDAMMNIT